MTFAILFLGDFMSSISCGKGLTVFFLTLFLGIGVVEFFVFEKQISINLRSVKTNNQSKAVCVKTEDSYKQNEKMVLMPCEIDSGIYVLEENKTAQVFIEKIESQK
jgi:hypothetical protein